MARAALLAVDQLARAGLRDRHPLGVGAQRGRLQRLRLLLLQLLLLLPLPGRKRGLDAAAPLLLKIKRILLVDIFLLSRCRIGTCNVEAAVLHEVIIGVAATRLAAAGK